MINNALRLLSYDNIKALGLQIGASAKAPLDCVSLFVLI